ncbi:MAG: class II fructose-bisphosphate aldolase [Candidatus Buchananbacteria bacterium]
MIVSSKVLFKQAYGKYAIGAYNINNAEQVMGLFLGNQQSQAPFIVQITKGAWDYTNALMVENIIRAADKIFPKLVFGVHLDHGDEKSCLQAIKTGLYSSVMIDASAMDFRNNVAATKRVVKAAHAKKIAVEAELGQLGGVEDHISVAESQAKLTDPNQALEFIKLTGIDSLACAVGTSHGAYKFSGTQSLHFEVMEKIQKLAPGFPLVLHGSSSVPADEVSRINAAGGKLGQAKGVDENDYQKAAKLGVCKINIDTDGRLVWCRVHREFFKNSPEVFDLRKPGKLFMQEFADYVAKKNEVLGSAGKLKNLKIK